MKCRLKAYITTKVRRLARVVKVGARTAWDFVCAAVAASIDWFKWW